MARTRLLSRRESCRTSGTRQAPTVTGPGDFQITSRTCDSSLKDGTTCTLSIAFTPTGAGLRTGTLTITSSAENSPLTFALSGTGVAPPLAITTTTLNVAYIGSSYSGMLQATGGVRPYDWTVVSGSLPTNLSLDATTGVISGMATQPHGTLWRPGNRSEGNSQLCYSAIRLRDSLRRRGVRPQRDGGPGRSTQLFDGLAGRAGATHRLVTELSGRPEQGERSHYPCWGIRSYQRVPLC